MVVKVLVVYSVFSVDQTVDTTREIDIFRAQRNAESDRQDSAERGGHGLNSQPQSSVAEDSAE